MKKRLSLPTLVAVCIASWAPSAVVAGPQDQTLGIPYITTSPSTRPNDTWKLSIALLSSDLDDTKASDDRLQLAADRSSERQASESKERRERAKEKSKIDSATRDDGRDSEAPSQQDRYYYQKNEKFTPLEIPRKHLDPIYKRYRLNELRRTARPSRLFFSSDASADAQLRRVLSGASANTQLGRALSNLSYDNKLNWSWTAPKGFGRYNRVSMQGNDLLATVNHGGLLHGTLFQAGTSKEAAKAGCLSGVDCFVWTEIGGALHSPNFIADAAFKLHQPHLGKTEIVAIIPSDTDRNLMQLFETADLGKTWQEVKIPKPGGGFFELRNLGKDYGGNSVTELHQFPVKAPGSSAFRMFLFNYNRIDKQYGYYFDGNTWRPSSFNTLPPPPAPYRPSYAQQTYFTDGRFGLLSPIKEHLYVTDDFGQSWTHLLDFNTDPQILAVTNDITEIAFGITEDGASIYVVLNDKVPAGHDVHWMKGTRQADGTYNFTAPQTLTPTQNLTVQFLTINRENNDDVTLWYYMKGPFNTNNAQQEPKPEFSRLFPDSGMYLDKGYLDNSSQFFINGGPLYLSAEAKGFTGNEINKFGIFVNLPIDVREVFRHPTHAGETLVASDQGLWVVGRDVNKIDPQTGQVHAHDVYLKNLAESRDHSEVDGVAVDACGCIYAGQWHGSATFQCDGSWLYRGGEASGLFIGKNRLSCKPGNEWLSNWGELGEDTTFAHFATRCKDYPKRFCRQQMLPGPLLSQLDAAAPTGFGNFPKPGSPPLFVELTENPAPGSWTTFQPGGHFIYIGRDKNLYLTPAGVNDLKFPQFPIKARGLLGGKIHRFALDDKTNQLYVLGRFASSKLELRRNDLKGGGWEVVLGNGFSGAYPSSVTNSLTGGASHDFDEKSQIDAYNGQVLFSAKKATGGDRVICVLNDNVVDDPLKNSSPLRCYKLLTTGVASDTSMHENPWNGLSKSNEAFYEQVVIDRVCPSRMYVVLRNKNTVRHCHQHTLVSDEVLDNGSPNQLSVRSWKQFGGQMQCGYIQDIDFDIGRKLMIVAHHGRGVMKGSLKDLNCPQ